MARFLKSLRGEVLYGCLIGAIAVLYLVALAVPFNSPLPTILGLPRFIFWELVITLLLAGLLAVAFVIQNIRNDF
ncbi:MAG: hypothetical protein AB1576_10420 [Bacillota bacterium]